MPAAESDFVHIEVDCYITAVRTKITCHTSPLSTSILIEDDKKEARILQAFSDLNGKETNRFAIQ